MEMQLVVDKMLGDVLSQNHPEVATLSTDKLAISDFETYSGAVSGEFLHADTLGVDYTSINYTATSANISGQLNGIDLKLGTTLSTLTANSGGWESAEATVAANSASWEESVDITAVSASLTAHVSNFNSYSAGLNYAGITSTSANWNSVYATVTANSASWEESSDINTLSAAITGKLAISDFNTYSGSVSGDFATGDDLGVDYVSTSYTAANSTLSGNLQGIDVALSGKLAITDFNAYSAGLSGYTPSLLEMIWSVYSTVSSTSSTW